MADDSEYCVICHKYIGPGYGPPLCAEKSCRDLLEYEMEFKRWAKEQSKKEGKGSDKKPFRWEDIEHYYYNEPKGD